MPTQVVSRGSACPDRGAIPAPGSIPGATVDTPIPGAVVHSAVHVEGTAATNEANVILRVVSPAGDILGQTFTTAREALVLRFYETDLEFEVGAPQPGCLEILEVDAADGSDRVYGQVPLILLP